MKHDFLFILIFLLFILSCKKSDLTAPPVIPEKYLKNAIAISDTVMKNMEGIYALSEGSGDLGTEFVCKVSKTSISFFSNYGGIYFILKCGLNLGDSAIRFSGFWRYSESTQQGVINLSVAVGEGGSALLMNGDCRQLTLSGNISGKENSARDIRIKYKRPFSSYAIDHEFMIFAHHGVQTTANPPYTENSLNGAVHAQDYGVNGLEFDVHLTKDHIPICTHDAFINTGVTEKGPLSGNYIQYNFSFLEASVRLNDGEKIPSVEQVLNAVTDSSTLQYMWLDIKGDPDIFKWLEPVIRRANAKAAKVNRKIEIITDLTSDEVITEFLKCPGYNSLLTMSEMSLDDAILHKCKYWAPRYSLGLLLNDLEKAHRCGIKVLSWTLNDRNLILDYLVNGKFDGFISDYPAYVVYDYYNIF